MKCDSTGDPAGTSCVKLHLVAVTKARCPISDANFNVLENLGQLRSFCGTYCGSSCLCSWNCMDLYTNRHFLTGWVMSGFFKWNWWALAWGPYGWIPHKAVTSLTCTQLSVASFLRCPQAAPRHTCSEHHGMFSSATAEISDWCSWWGQRHLWEVSACEKRREAELCCGFWWLVRSPAERLRTEVGWRCMKGATLCVSEMVLYDFRSRTLLILGKDVQTY